MKKYIYGKTCFGNKPECVMIDITNGFTVDVRMEDIDLVVTISNAQGTQTVSDFIDCSLALHKATSHDIESEMVDEVRRSLEDIIKDSDNPMFTDLYELVVEWEQFVADNFEDIDEEESEGSDDKSDDTKDTDE